MKTRFIFKLLPNLRGNQRNENRGKRSVGVVSCGEDEMISVSSIEARMGQLMNLVGRVSDRGIHRGRKKIADRFVRLTRFF